MFNRPLISFCLFAYNQEEFIREAVEGAFAQTYSPLEIILSDDGSSDRTFEIMTQMVAEYNGPHTVVLNRNQPNLGLVPHVNKVIMEISRGDIIVMAAGDDISLPERVEMSWKILRENPDANCVSFRMQTIDKNGDKIDSVKSSYQFDKYSLRDFIDHNEGFDKFNINGASRAFRKTVYDFFGPLTDKSQTEDSPTFLRCLMIGKACYSGNIAVYYRIHGMNIYASDRKYLIRYKRIYYQYTKDISFAVNGSFICDEEKYHLKKILKNVLTKNIIMSNFYLSQNKIKFFCKNILCNKMIDSSVKYFYLKVTLKSMF